MSIYIPTQATSGLDLQNYYTKTQTNNILNNYITTTTPSVNFGTGTFQDVFSTKLASGTGTFINLSSGTGSFKSLSSDFLSSNSGAFTSLSAMTGSINDLTVSNTGTINNLVCQNGTLASLIVKNGNPTITFTTRTPATNTDDISTNGYIYISSGLSATNIYYSTDLLSWSNAGGSSAIINMKYIEDINIFCGCKATPTYQFNYSRDGLIWNAVNFAKTSYLHREVDYSPKLNMLCVVSNSAVFGTDYIETSLTQGKSWTAQTHASANNLISVSWCNVSSKFYICDTSGNIFYSSDGTTWNLTVPTGLQASSSISFITCFNGILILTGSLGVGKTQLAYSTDSGVSFVPVLENSTTISMNSKPVYSKMNNLLVIYGDLRIYYSIDGINWNYVANNSTIPTYSCFDVKQNKILGGHGLDISLPKISDISGVNTTGLITGNVYSNGDILTNTSIKCKNLDVLKDFVCGSSGSFTSLFVASSGSFGGIVCLGGLSANSLLTARQNISCSQTGLFSTLTTSASGCFQGAHVRNDLRCLGTGTFSNILTSNSGSFGGLLVSGRSDFADVVTTNSGSFGGLLVKQDFNAESNIIPPGKWSIDNLGIFFKNAETNTQKFTISANSNGGSTDLFSITNNIDGAPMAQVYGTADAASVSQAALVVDGGLGIAKNIIGGKNIFLSSTGEINFDTSKFIYEEYLHTTDWSGIWASNVSGDIKITRNGRVITISTPDVLANSNSSNIIDVATVLPAKYRPAIAISGVLRAVDDLVNKFGTWKIFTSGAIQISCGPALSNTFAGAGNTSGFISFSATYKI